MIRHHAFQRADIEKIFQTMMTRDEDKTGVWLVACEPVPEAALQGARPFLAIDCQPYFDGMVPLPSPRFCREMAKMLNQAADMWEAGTYPHMSRYEVPEGGDDVKNLGTDPDPVG
jgi:hypothetical protein